MKYSKLIFMNFTILIFIFFIFICSGCDQESPEELRRRANEIEQRSSPKIIRSNIGTKYFIVKIGQHDYLEHIQDHRFGICHYKDCEYCLKQNSKDKK